MLKFTITALTALFVFLSVLVLQALVNAHNDGALLAIPVIVGMNAVLIWFWIRFMEEV